VGNQKTGRLTTSQIQTKLSPLDRSCFAGVNWTSCEHSVKASAQFCRSVIRICYIHVLSVRAKEKIQLIELHTCRVLHQRSVMKDVTPGEKQYSLWCQHKKQIVTHSNYTWRRCSVLISAMLTGMTGFQMVEITTLGWLIGCSSGSSRDMWADSLCLVYEPLV
jgi:hypothetical protein